MREYFTTEKGNQGISWVEGDQRITEVYDKKYRLRDFFKPTRRELIIFRDAVIVSIPLLSFTDFPESLLYAAMPQALIYTAVRAYELFGRDDDLKSTMRGTKVLSPHKRVLNRTIESLDGLL